MKRSKHAAARGLLVVLLCLASLPAAAAPAEDDSVLLGAALLVQDRPYRDFRSGDRKLFAPVARGRWGRFFVDALYENEGYVGAELWRKRTVTVNALGRLNTQRYEADDSPFLAGMADRDAAFELGAEAAWRPNDFGVRLQGFADVTGEHEGYELRAEVTWERSFRGWDARYALGGLYQSDDLVGHYFGVEPGEATAERPAFAPDGEWTGRAAGTLFYNFQRPVTLILHLEYRWFGEEIEWSPIVENDRQWTGTIGLAWRIGGKTPAAGPMFRRRY